MNKDFWFVCLLIIVSSATNFYIGRQSGISHGIHLAKMSVFKNHNLTPKQRLFCVSAIEGENPDDGNQ